MLVLRNGFLRLFVCSVSLVVWLLKFSVVVKCRFDWCVSDVVCSVWKNV